VMLVGVLLVSDDGSDWCVIYNQIGLFNYQIGHIDTNRIQIGDPERAIHQIQHPIWPLGFLAILTIKSYSTLFGRRISPRVYYC